jgi:mannitol-1-phosphate 5-dehydrogenase
MAGTEDRPQIVIIGAGATGRGQIGRLAHEAGFAITFIEIKRDLVNLLRSAGKYVVGLAGETVRILEVSGFEIFHDDDVLRSVRAIADADLVATAVLPTNLEAIAPLLASGLAMKSREGITKPLNIIACENMERSSRTLQDLVRQRTPRFDWGWVDSHIGFPDAMVACLVPWPTDPLFLLAEEMQEWSVDARAVKRPIPDLPGLTLSENQDAALERKLYIKNTGHLAIGVLGYLKGYTLMHEAARDPEDFALAAAATRESAAAVVAKHGFEANETEEYRRTFLEQMRSPYLPDDIKRVLRELSRKLSREERLVGPAMLSCAQGRAPRALAEIIARALTIRNPDDPQTVELQGSLRSTGIERTIEEVCGISPGEALSKLILTKYKYITRGVNP